MLIDDETKKEEIQFECLITGLIENQFGFCNDFLPSNTIMGLKTNIKDLLKTSSLILAGVGNEGDLKKNILIRGDKINWIESDSINEFEILYLQKVEKFISYLNKTCFTSIRCFESHYSNYKKGAFYKRHIDQFKSETGRKYSIVLYLNQDWRDLDGGLLSLYPTGRKQEDISPKAGKLVFFKSDEMEHEVHPSYTRDRNSIAAWFKN